MSRSWTFTPLEFKVLCERYRGGRMPAPFVFTTDILTIDEYERAKRDTWTALAGRHDGALQRAFETLTAPEAFIGAQSWVDHDFDNPKHWLRFHAARRGSHAVVLTQEPGRTLDHSGTCVMTECQPRAMAEEFVAVLPRAAAGRLPDIAIVTKTPQELEEAQFQRNWIKDTSDDEPEERSKRFVNTPAERTGSIAIVQGQSKFGPRGIIEQTLIWRDLADDGRYVMVGGDNPIAMGLDAQRLTRMIQGTINAIMLRLDSHWEPGGQYE